MPRRLERVNQLLREEISDLMRREMKDPRLTGLVSLTEVETSVDLHYANVFVSVLGSEEEKGDALTALNSAARFLRRELTKRLSLRYTPELRFIPDTSMERGARLQELINRLHAPADPS